MKSRVAAAAGVLALTLLACFALGWMWVDAWLPESAVTGVVSVVGGTGVILAIVVLLGWRVSKAGPVHLIEEAQNATRSAERLTEIAIDMAIKLHQRLGSFGPGSSDTELFEWRDRIESAVEGDYWTDSKLNQLVRGPMTRNGLVNLGGDVWRSIRDEWSALPDRDNAAIAQYSETKLGRKVVAPAEFRRMARDLAVADQCASTLDRYERIYRDQSRHLGGAAT